MTIPRLATVNAHINCLPWDRGAGPNFLKKDLEPLRQVLARRGWDTPIREVAALDHDTIHGARRRRRP